MYFKKLTAKFFLAAKHMKLWNKGTKVLTSFRIFTAGLAFKLWLAFSSFDTNIGLE